MAVGDLLWACPYCRTERGIRRAGRGRERCTGCGASFRRGPGSTIVGEHPVQGRRVAAAAEWVDGLPVLDPGASDGAGEGREPPSPRKARVEAAFASAEVPVRKGGGEVIGFIERRGKAEAGELIAEGGCIRLVLASGREFEWAIPELTAIQSSSRSLQLKLRDHPVLTLRFTEDSPRFWETLLQELVRAYYRAAGQGEVREFQPRIVSAPGTG